MYLTGEAATWHHREKAHLANWAVTKAALLKRFGPKISVTIAYHNLVNITKTEQETFHEYLHRFEKIVDYIGVVPSLDELLDFFTLGINKYDRREVYYILWPAAPYANWTAAHTVLQAHFDHEDSLGLLHHRHSSNSKF